mmetsp:Transcript_36704/g.48355  ORF Transcript_36704/g.48355 Transcript_36704/m.48355 type:complete len:455 (+) Transcript_36704:2-1366(+)
MSKNQGKRSSEEDCSQQNKRRYQNLEDFRQEKGPAILLEGTPPTFKETSPALCFQLHALAFPDKGANFGGQARAGTMHLPHGPVRTPVFMPVGTKGSIKGLASRQLYSEAANPEIILGNTYHLALQPGTEVLERQGGLHRFMNWKNNLLTDSGGFQMVSLSELSKVTEDGVTFQSPFDGKEMLLRPEDSTKHQVRIGSDIMMQLDDVVDVVEKDQERFVEGCHRTLRWLDRCIAAQEHPHQQNLFGIVQGGLDVSPGGLRDISVAGMVERDLPGYAIGGLSGGEAKDDFWKVVAKCTESLPRDRPRYLMGVGYPVDLVVCVALGVDMFDCVFPTRTARFGVALVPWGQLKLKNNEFSGDDRPIDTDCKCTTCQTYSRSFLHVQTKGAHSLGCQLITIHNISYMMNLMRSMRHAIMEGHFQQFVKSFMNRQFSHKDIPSWVHDALVHANIFERGK